MTKFLKKLFWRVKMNDRICDIKISNCDRIVYDRPKITKLEVAKYYKEISKKIMPYIQNRPISVIRCHNGIKGEKFFKKHPAEFEDVERIKIGKNQPYFYLTNTKQLIYQVQMGSLEFHTWASNVNNISSPDIMVFDLDPDEKMPLKTLQEGVLKLKDILDELNLTSFLKTSGGKGYHVAIPFKNIINYKKFNDFASKIAIFLENTSNLFTTNIRKENRKGKIFVDVLRNKKGATCVCPYSLRARENAPISMPIAWKDLQDIKPNEVNINNYKDYLNKSWNNFFKINQTIK